MANAKSHHLNNAEAHVLVAIDQQPREASYTTVYDDGTRGASVHVLYYEKNPDKAEGKGEVRSIPYEEWLKPTQPIVLPPAATPITVDDLIGVDASTLPEEAGELLRAFGGISKEGTVLPLEKWACNLR